MKAILITMFVGLSLCAMGFSDITLRLNPSFYDESTQTLYVNVELRYDGQGQFLLADQNYRLFYDSELLSLEEEKSRSDLPTDLYSKLQFMEILEGLEADDINQLSFDDKLGFVNFNIDLHNTLNGGIAIRQQDDWQRVAVLNFKVSKEESLSELVWSKSGVTDQYATAFVEIMEWIAPNQTRPADIEEYIDASFNNTEEDHHMTLSIAPNPSTDFIKIAFEQDLASNMEVIIYDMIGREVKKTIAYRGSSNLNLAITDLIGGTYTIELIDANKTISTSNFVKIDR